MQQNYGQAVEQLSKEKRKQILIAIAVGTFLGPLDGSVVNIALPTIGDYYQVPLPTVEWVVMSYLLVISSLLLTYGRMGDLYGHKRIYLTGFVVFTIGSLLCGLAPSILLLIVFRAVQAIGAGMLMAIGPAIVTHIAPPQERGKSLGIIAIAVSVALAVGPVLGGMLTSKFGWQSVFFINIPIGIIATIWSYKIIPNIKSDAAQPFDFKGSILIFLALISLLFSLSNGENYGWNNKYIISLLILGIVFMVTFIILEKRIKYPMLDLSLFNNKLFSMGNLTALLNFMAQFSVILIMPFYLQDLLGLAPSQAGLMLIPMPLVVMIIAPISGAISDRIDARYISSLGMATVTLGLWLLSKLTIASTSLYIMGSLSVIGLGSGMFQTPNNSAILGSVPPHRRGIASSMLAIMRNIGMVLGVAISGAVFSTRMNSLTETLSMNGVNALELKAQAYAGAIHTTFLVSAIIAAIGVFSSLIRGSLNSK